MTITRAEGAPRAESREPRETGILEDFRFNISDFKARARAALSSFKKIKAAEGRGLKSEVLSDEDIQVIISLPSAVAGLLFGKYWNFLW